MKLRSFTWIAIAVAACFVVAAGLAQEDEAKSKKRKTKKMEGLVAHAPKGAPEDVVAILKVKGKARKKKEGEEPPPAPEKIIELRTDDPDVKHEIQVLAFNGAEAVVEYEGKGEELRVVKIAPAKSREKKAEKGGTLKPAVGDPVVL